MTTNTHRRIDDILALIDDVIDDTPAPATAARPAEDTGYVNPASPAAMCGWRPANTLNLRPRGAVR